MEKKEKGELEKAVYELLSRTLCISEIRNFAKTRFEYYYSSMSENAKLADTKDMEKFKESYKDAMVHIQASCQYADFIKYMDECEQDAMVEIEKLQKKIDESD